MCHSRKRVEMRAFFAVAPASVSYPSSLLKGNPMISPNLIGPLPLALVGLANEHHGLVLDIVNRLKDEGADDTHRRLAVALHGKPLPNAEPMPAAPPTPTLIFRKKTLLGTTSVVVYGFGKDLSFPQMCRPVVKVGDDVSVDEIERLLKERGHTFSEAKFEEILEKQKKFFLKQEDGEDFGLRADWWNLVLVEDEHGAVSVVSVGWVGVGWYRLRDSLGHGSVWNLGCRLVVSNSEALNLCPLVTVF